MLIKITSIDYRFGRIAPSERSKNVPDPYAPRFTSIAYITISTVRTFFEKVSDQCTILLTFELIVNNVRGVRWKVILTKIKENVLECDLKK